MCPFCIATSTLTGISAISASGVAAVFVRLIAKDEKSKTSQNLSQRRSHDGDNGNDSSEGGIER
jgi:hypothetical protein